MRTFSWPLLLTAAMAAGACVPMIVTTTASVPSARKPADKALKPGPSPAPTTPGSSLGAIAGQVLGLDGRAAAGVTVTAHVIAAGGGNVIAAGGGNVIAAGGGNFKVLAGGAMTAKTDAQGNFTLKPSGEGRFNVEAVLADDVKAIQLDVTPGAKTMAIQLAKTGAISGKVSASEAPTVTDFEGADVFIPGTGYLAKAAKDGSFTLTNVPVGSFSLVATKAGLGRANTSGVVVASEKTTSVPALLLSVTAPAVTAVTPAMGGAETAITLKGEHFGASAGQTFSITVGGIAVSDPTRTNDQTISFKLPANAGAGGIVVTVAGVASNAGAFKPIHALTLVSPPARLAVGKSIVLAVNGTDPSGAAIEAPPVTWTVEGDARSVDATGKLTAKKAGTATVKASNGKIEAKAEVQVEAALAGVTTFAGTGAVGSTNGPAGQATFMSLYGIAIDSQDNVFVSDNHRIRKITPAGVVSTFAGSGAFGHVEGAGTDARFSRIAGLAIDGQDNLYALDTGNSRIRKITPAGATSTVYLDAITDSSAPAGHYRHLAIDGAGNIYVTLDGNTDDENRVLHHISPAGTLTAHHLGVNWGAVSEENGYFRGVAFDTAGQLFLAENGGDNHLIRQLSPTKVGSVRAGGTTGASTDGPAASARFWHVTGLVFDKTGNLYVSEGTRFETPSHRIRQIAPDGTVRTIAGDDKGFAEGYGAAARFNEPGAMAIDSQGRIYVVDNQNNRIRRLDLNATP